jgi:membrane-bound lytic murein transglycosylase D
MRPVPGGGGPQPQEQKPSVWTPQEQKPSVWMQTNPRIHQFVKQYQSGKYVESALKRAQTYMPHIQKVFTTYRLPPQLGYLPVLESGFNVEADSGPSRGLWQFTKATAEQYGLTVGRLQDERLNWEKSTEAAAKYLADLGRRFAYNWELVLAAYNGGPGYIERATQAQQTRNFWQLKLYRETTDYVPRFIAILQVARETYPHLLAQHLAMVQQAFDEQRNSESAFVPNAGYGVALANLW